MSGPGLQERLERAEPPEGRAAEHRSWAVLHAAFAERTPRRRQRPIAGVALTLALLALVTTVALTPPGAAVADWVERILGDPAPPARTTIGPLPGDGRLLLTAAGRVWVVDPDGTRRSIAAADGATWSPRGLYVAAWRGTTLNALAPDGRVAWTQDGLGDVRAATWSPDGFRIAYRRAGALWVVAGDGSGARVVDATARGEASAWRPGAPHVLSWIDRDGHIVVRNPDSDLTDWRSSQPARFARELLWSSDGSRVAAVGAGRAWIFHVGAGTARDVSGDLGPVRSAAWAPSGDRIALITNAGPAGLQSVVVLRAGSDTARPLFTASRLRDVTWSPAGRTLLVGWPHADQWLLLPTDARRRATAISGLSRRFGGDPVLRGWCCSTQAEP